MAENITPTKGELILISWLAIGFVYETVKELMEILDFEEILKKRERKKRKNKKEMKK